MRVGFLAVIVLALFASVAVAATDDTNFTTTVNAVDNLIVPATSGATLSTMTGGNYDEATQVDTDGLMYTHNSSTDKKITAVAAADAGNAANDLDLDITVESGAGEFNLVIDGADQSASTVYSGMAAGYYEKNITWQTKGTSAGTQSGSYLWVVTFTSQDDS
jgi:hypothetical protein